MNYLALLKETLAKNSKKVPPAGTAKTAKSPTDDKAVPREPAGDTVMVDENSGKHAIDSTAKTVKSTFWQLRQYPFKHVSGKLSTSSAIVQPPAPTDRLCYQCASFQRSSYGFPLGLCQQHGNRIQHSASQPTQFGCGDFVLRPPADDSRTCLACRHYSRNSTMCSMVNTDCPYPAIPPCSGTKFQQGKPVIQGSGPQVEGGQSGERTALAAG